MTLKMTKEAQERMQERIGVLITGEIPEPYQILRQMLKGEKVIAIGDVVAENLIKAGIEPDMMVVDGKSMREEREIAVQCDITVKNRASEITEELMEAIRKGYKRIYVEGEEDLAALPAILYAEENSVIVYGQPSEGIMVIRPTEENKETVRKTLELFEKLE
ncbi:MAG: DUF359 domain-containing protein [Theionarchaea archaeon]|nr:MAG: hypothetical protein AYK18_06890 [Theionarchaea archaeon DG-70]MBU7012032.1 DUF359 domain-containing protein [Theionarchaea archaeon]